MSLSARPTPNADAVVASVTHDAASLAGADVSALIAFRDELESASAFPGDDLRRLARDLRRGRALLRRAGGDPARDDLLAAVEQVVQERLAGLRVATAEIAAEATISRSPLLRPILERLSIEPAASSQIATAIAKSKEHTSRVLRTLEADALVEVSRDPNDGRRRIYALTPAGETEAARLLSFGPADDAKPIPTVSSEDVRAFLRAALEDVVALRRRTGNYADAASRLQAIVVQAHREEDRALELRTRVELLTTYRQCGEHGDAEEQEFRELLSIANAQNETFPAAFVMPACAHLQYEWGRRPAKSKSEQETLLIAAQTSFRMLGSRGDECGWDVRRGWALVALSDLYRVRGAIGEALDAAVDALQLFHTAEDAYGTIRAQFMLGFCLRLRGQFGIAGRFLDLAFVRARDEGYERFAADALTQLGETARCLGNVADAETMLTDAQEWAFRLGRPVTGAFATSSLAATRFGAENDDAALDGFEEAIATFRQRGHRTGLALNLRRLAVVRRRAGQLDAARQAIGESLALYQALGCPAGMAACNVESVYVARAAGGDAAQEIDALDGLLNRRDLRPLPELDPWLPTQLTQLAAAVGRPELDRHVDEVVEGSEQFRARHESELPQVVVMLDAPYEEQASQTGEDEMAGEPRRLWRSRGNEQAQPALA